MKLKQKDIVLEAILGYIRRKGWGRERKNRGKGGRKVIKKGEKRKTLRKH